MRTSALLASILLTALPSAHAEEPTATIDRLVASAWHKARITPAAAADDATFLRRVTLDLTGTIPTADEVTAFLDDRAPDKRAHAVERLLADPRWAEHQADYWEVILVGRGARQRPIDRAALHGWLRDRFAEKIGFDELARRLLTAEGVSGPGTPGDPTPPGRTDGAVNYFLHYNGSLADLAGTTARELLGVQIQCAQCHNHPTEKWTQRDFRRFAAAFAHTRVRPYDRAASAGTTDGGVAPAAMGMGRRFEVEELPRVQFLGGKAMPMQREIALEKPTALDGADLDGERPRARLAAWITDGKNPWFARELVNRTWGYLVGRGFFEPVDDQRPGNPATLALLLDALAADLVAHGFDLRRLTRQICASRVYQLSSGRARGSDPDGRLWSRHRLRPLGPELLVAALERATSVDRALAVLPAAKVAQIEQRVRQSVSFLFDVDEEAARDDFEGTLQQALMLQNGSLLNAAASTLPGTALAEILDGGASDEAAIRALYLRTLSRPPDAAELAKWRGYVGERRELVEATAPSRTAPVGGGKRRDPAPDPLAVVGPRRLRAAPPTARAQALEDLQWALLNSSEFVFRP